MHLANVRNVFTYDYYELLFCIVYVPLYICTFIINSCNVYTIVVIYLEYEYSYITMPMTSQ